MKLRPYLLIPIITLLLAPLALGQAPESERGVVTGTVTDADGEPLPGVQITDPTLERGTTTDADGAYALAGLPAGRHTLEFRFTGFETAIETVSVNAGETVSLNVQLAQATLRTRAVTVTGTPVAQDLLRSVQDVDVLSEEDLAVRPTAALGTLLQEQVPGVSSIKTGGQAGKPVLRGLSGNRIRVLKNSVGQEFYQFGVRHFPTTSVNEAERIEVVRGPSSILYGSDALGGAINVISKDVPTAGSEETFVGGQVDGQYKSNNNERAGALDLRGARGSVGFRAGFERRIADNFNAPDVPIFGEVDPPNVGRFGDPRFSGEIPFTNFRQWSGYGQVGVQGEFGQLQLYGDYWTNDHNFLLPTPPPADPIGLGQELEQANAMLKGNVLAGDFVLKPRLAYQRAERRSAGAGNPLDVIDAADDFDFPIDLAKDIVTARLDAVHPEMGLLSGTIGAEFRYLDGRSNGSVQLEPSSETISFGAFIFEEIDLDPLTLSSGLRLDVLNQEADPFPIAVERLNLTDDQLENTYVTLSGSVGGNYRLAEGVAAVANLSTGFRAPSIFELYADGQHGGVFAWQQGNPTLDPERSYSIDGSLRLERSWIQGEVTLYQNWINDYIFLSNRGETFEQEAGPDLPIFDSEQTDAWLRGFEGDVRVAPRPWLELGIEGAILATNGDGLENNPIPNSETRSDGDLPLIPADNLGGLVRLESDLGQLQSAFVQTRVRHVFEKDAAGAFEPFSQFDQSPPPPPPPFGTASTEAYTLVHLETGVTVPFQNMPLRFSLRVDNLLNEVHRDFLDTYKGYALSPGRDVQVSLHGSF